jgi:hypothetical protein
MKAFIIFELGLKNLLKVLVDATLSDLVLKAKSSPNGAFGQEPLRHRSLRVLGTSGGTPEVTEQRTFKTPLSVHYFLQWQVAFTKQS